MSRRDGLVADCRALALCVGRDELTLTTLERYDIAQLERLHKQLADEYLERCF